MNECSSQKRIPEKTKIFLENDQNEENSVIFVVEFFSGFRFLAKASKTFVRITIAKRGKEEREKCLFQLPVTIEQFERDKQCFDLNYLLFSENFAKKRLEFILGHFLDVVTLHHYFGIDDDILSI